jgi:SAM-dependent methyltransferase
MSTSPKAEGTATAVQQPPIPIYLDARATFAAHYLFGKGLEIGPLHLPLAMPPHAKVKYVDRMSVADLRAEYPELATWNLTEPDIVDDGEKLTKVAEESQDFIVANHFLEHTENPIGTIQTHLGKLKPGGILFYAVPDKRFTFDFRRPVTPLEHMVADYEQGPERSRREHYEEWTRLVVGEPSSAAGSEGAVDEDQATTKARELEADAYSIHMHVWTEAEFLELILEIRRRTEGAFDIEASARQGIECMVVLRKAGAAIDPVAPAPGDPAAPAPAPQLRPVGLRLRMRRALRAAKREIIGNRP